MSKALCAVVCAAARGELPKIAAAIRKKKNCFAIQTSGFQVCPIVWNKGREYSSLYVTGNWFSMFADVNVLKILKHSDCYKLKNLREHQIADGRFIKIKECPMWLKYKARQYFYQIKAIYSGEVIFL